MSASSSAVRRRPGITSAPVTAAKKKNRTVSVQATTRSGPPLRPNGKSREWTLTYDPAGNKGNGSIHATLDGEAATLDLAPGVKAQGITLDRFGLFTWRPDGNSNDVFFDDLTYTAAPPK